ncbi:MAG: MBL fold metallo-hydrolase [Oscillatoriaceae cyanobacterium Prado104]|jgi:glyoxylase-like metal-dependent hydrolase (beta-lactamase superfamily II)|nr:MBL fold metallo-hydrolase [Oscillatoriaceae cyanobacterium Prado104]
MAISRRTFLTGAIATSFALPATGRLLAQTTRPMMPRNSGIYRFKLGNFNLISISDGTLSVPAAIFAGNAKPEELQEVLKQGFQGETLSADCNVLLVDTGQNKVLIDTGSGLLNGATVGKLIENLQQAQIKPIDITAVILTHAHSDHVGGLNGKSGLTFPNARFFISKQEWNFWTGNSVDLPKFGGPAEMKKQAIEIAQKQLGLIRDRVTQFDVNQEFLPGFTAIPAYGHTPGHVAIRITSGNAVMVHTADTVHINTINLWNPSWQPIFDADREMAAATRQAVLEKIAGDRTLMFAYHFPYPGLGHLRARDRGGFDWQPVNWQFES